MKGPRPAQPGRKYSIGVRFGRLVIIGWVDQRQRRCRCDCGTERTVTIANLGTFTFSCGCLRREAMQRASTTHGHARHGKVSRTYRTWLDMRKRCNNPNNKHWKNYGGRGITVDRTWDDYAQFLADMGERPPGLTLERRENNGPYCKENCTWATQKQQSINTRRNHYVTYEGQTHALSVWAEKLGKSYPALLARLRAGWAVEHAFTQEVRNVMR